MPNEAELSADLLKEHPHGHRTSVSRAAAARVLFEAVVERIQKAARAESCEWDVAVETESPPGSQSYHFVRGLIVQTDKTHVIPVEITQNVVRVDGMPIFTGHHSAAQALVSAVFAAVRAVQEGKAC